MHRSPSVCNPASTASDVRLPQHQLHGAPIGCELSAKGWVGHGPGTDEAGRADCVEGALLVLSLQKL